MGSKKSFEIQVVQTAVGDDENLRVLFQQGPCRRDQHSVEQLAIAVGRFENVLWSGKSLAIALHSRIDFRAGRKRKQAGLHRRDRPQVRLLPAQPVKENCALDSLRELLRVQRWSSSCCSLWQQSQPLGQSSGAAEVGPLKGRTGFAAGY